MAAPDLKERLIDEVAAFAHDPLGFVLFAFPWGEPGTVLADVDGPRQWQCQVLAELGHRLRAGHAVGEQFPILMARASGHGVGKSTVAAWVILWGLSTMPNARVVVTANTDSQLRTKTWPEVTKWLRLLINRDWFKATATAVFKRAEMWGRLREWLQAGAIDNDPDLLADLAGVEYGYALRDGRDAIQLERKEDMKRRGLASPDNGDALALTFAYPVTARWTYPRARSKHRFEYDPYAEFRDG